MLSRSRQLWLIQLAVCSLVTLSAGCESYFFLPDKSAADSLGTASNGAVPIGEAYTQDLIQERTFTDGTSVTTVTYAATDYTRTPLGVDFNDDGKIDPVVGYGQTQAVIQILLSRPESIDVDPISLTLDSKRDMQNLADVAVGDIDNDGYLDIVAAAEAAIWYYRHPASGVTTDLRSWGMLDPNNALHERIDASVGVITDSELMAIITQAVGPGVNLDDYIVTIQQLFTNVELADFDNDNDHDVAASRSFVIDLTPRPDVPVVPLQIVDGDVMIFVNPGYAQDGLGWTQVSIGSHERQQRLDRDGASGLLVVDMDGDGLLDLVSAASLDNNAQIAWFRNPGGTLTTENPWTQYRVGSVRDARSVDIGDLTGDGWPDVVATGGSQQQLLLFEHPAVAFPDERYEYDWDTHVIVTFESFEPRDVKMLDMDLDGVLELVVGGTEGALRFFESPADPTQPWNGGIITTFDGGGEVGLLGFGDMDGDVDLDLVAVISSLSEENQSRTVWIRNELIK